MQGFRGLGVSSFGFRFEGLGSRAFTGLGFRSWRY